MLQTVRAGKVKIFQKISEVLNLNFWYVHTGDEEDVLPHLSL